MWINWTQQLGWETAGHDVLREIAIRILGIFWIMRRTCWWVWRRGEESFWQLERKSHWWNDGSVTALCGPGLGPGLSLASDWTTQVTWPGYWPVIGPRCWWEVLCKYWPLTRRLMMTITDLRMTQGKLSSQPLGILVKTFNFREGWVWVYSYHPPVISHVLGEIRNKWCGWNDRNSLVMWWHKTWWEDCGRNSNETHGMVRTLTAVFGMGRTDKICFGQIKSPKYRWLFIGYGDPT